MLCMKFNRPSCFKALTNNDQETMVTLSNCSDKVDHPASSDSDMHTDRPQNIALHSTGSKQDVQASSDSEIHKQGSHVVGYIDPKKSSNVEKVPSSSNCETHPDGSHTSTSNNLKMECKMPTPLMEDILVLPDNEAPTNESHIMVLHDLSKNIDSMRSDLRSLHHMISDVIKKQADAKKEEKQNTETENQWLNLALVLDRLFFMIYLIGIISALMVLFPLSWE